jgi:hypothetical protein
VSAYSLGLARSFVKIDLAIRQSQACYIWGCTLAGLHSGFVITECRLVRTNVEFCAGKLDKVLLVVGTIGIAKASCHGQGFACFYLNPVSSVNVLVSASSFFLTWSHVKSKYADSRLQAGPDSEGCTLCHYCIITSISIRVGADILGTAGSLVKGVRAALRDTLAVALYRSALIYFGLVFIIYRRMGANIGIATRRLIEIENAVPRLSPANRFSI